MTIAAAAVALQRDRQNTRRTVNLTFTGNYVAGGDTLDLTLLTNLKGIDGMKTFSRVPDFFEALNQPIAFQIQLIIGADNKTHKVKIWDEVAGTELAAGAYPAGLTAATITIAFDVRQGA